MMIHYVLAFLLYIAVFFACLGSILMRCTAMSIRIGLWAFLFSTVIIVIFVIQKLEPHTAFLVLTYTCALYVGCKCIPLLSIQFL